MIERDAGLAGSGEGTSRWAFARFLAAGLAAAALVARRAFAPGAEQFRFAFGCEPCLVGRLRQLERLANRLLERPEAQPGLDRRKDVGHVHADPLGVAKPQRQLHPLADFVLGQKRVGTQVKDASLPDTSRAASSTSPHGRPGWVRVEGPGHAALGEVEQPARQIADVHELDLALGRRRREYFAAAPTRCGQ